MHAKWILPKVVVTSMIGANTYLIPLLVLNIAIMRHNIVSLKLKYNHGTTEYRGIFSRYLPWSKISGTAQHYCDAIRSAILATAWLLLLDLVINFVVFDHRFDQRIASPPIYSGLTMLYISNFVHH